MTPPHILILTLHDPTEFDFAGWLGAFARTGTLSLVVDRHSVGDTTLAALRANPVFGFVQAYGNYLNNGNVYADLDRLHRERPVSHVLAFGEDDIVRAARLRERWGLPGQTVDNALGFRDKSRTRRIVESAGMASHPAAALDHPLSLLDFIDRHWLPVYVKPRTSSGSVFGRKLATPQQLTEFLEEGFAPRIPYSEFVSDLCVEVFQPGYLHHIDGIAVGSGLAWAWPSRYLSDGLEIGRLGQRDIVGSHMMSPDDPLFGPLVDYAGRACAHLALPDGHSFHAEVFVNPGGRLSLCEIACRTGGGRVNEAIHRAGGPDLNRWQFLLQGGAASADDAANGLRLCRPERLCGWMLIPPQPGTCREVPDFAGLDGIESFVLKIAPGGMGWARTFSGDAVGHLVVSGRTEAQLLSNMQAASAHMDAHLRFE
jgi:hypothetical protein